MNPENNVKMLNYNDKIDRLPPGVAIKGYKKGPAIKSSLNMFGSHPFQTLDEYNQFTVLLSTMDEVEALIAVKM